MPDLGDSEGDLDCILDSALADFESDAVVDIPPRELHSDIPQSLAPAGATGSAADAPGSIAEAGVKSDGQGEELLAFQDALNALNALESEGVGGPGDDDAEPGEDDMKLVEEFLKSLSSQFEKMGLPEESGDVPSSDAGNGTGSLANAEPSDTEPSANPLGATSAEEDIDRLTRELESLLGGGGKLNPDSNLFQAVAEPPTGGTEDVTRGGENAGRGVASGGGDFEKVVQSVVGELLSKEILRGPMKQMRDAYGNWLPANEQKLSAEDLARYRAQAEIASNICVEYEKDACRTETVMELLQRMQETGAPPPEVMAHLGGDEGSGSERGMGQAASQNPLADLEKLGNCPVQ